MSSPEISFIAQTFTNISNFFVMTYNIGKQVLRVDAVRAKGRIAQKKMAMGVMFRPTALPKRSKPRDSPE